MPAARKRRVADVDDDSPVETPDRTEPEQTRNRRRTATESPVDSGSDEEDDTQLGATQILGVNPLVKKMVRLALASEYSRQPIRRSDISQKVLGERSRQFKPVFAEAQKVLKDIFGMEMVEQPMKEKLSVSQRRAAQRAEKASSSSKSWTLVSTLPSKYRIPEILPPSKAPSSTIESSYIAIYTFIISLITLSGGAIQEQKLERYLRRVHADNYTPIDRTEKLLARLCKEGYIVRNRDVSGGEEVVEYLVGPRGKVEVGLDGVAGMAREVFGFGKINPGPEAQDEEVMREFEKRLERSLGISRQAEAGATQQQASAPVQNEQTRRRSRRGADVDHDGDYAG
ncbi:predicted protein [Uncinocarpus reesii 1704]|uniref:MAGE domain-containing protein n=1 Tax=Uncinocarpus reesii (strain UAMH 1704) TaxID=336963 RepID=C4JZF3_UNCRE|nr:uncharacterized protein UREG_07554 [Uncinocarpus reesii 1704]EEP82689.1 predicted protein [Uncinocarpus reesii 1704]